MSKIKFPRLALYMNATSPQSRPERNSAGGIICAYSLQERKIRCKTACFFFCGSCRYDAQPLSSAYTLKPVLLKSGFRQVGSLRQNSVHMLHKRFCVFLAH